MSGPSGEGVKNLSFFFLLVSYTKRNNNSNEFVMVFGSEPPTEKWMSLVGGREDEENKNI